MSSTNKTTNYELSQFVNDDIPTWLGDVNSDMSKIDNAIHGVDVKAVANEAAIAAVSAVAAAAVKTVNDNDPDSAGNVNLNDIKADVVAGNTDFNELVPADKALKLYEVTVSANIVVNQPTRDENNTTWEVITIRHLENYFIQFAIKVGSVNEIYTRTLSGSVWQGWSEVLVQGRTVDRIWANEDSTRPFDPQLINLDLSKYSAVVVQFKITANTAVQFFEYMIPTGFDTMTIGARANSSVVYKRMCTPSANGINFYAGYADTTLDNSAMIPNRIYGLK